MASPVAPAKATCSVHNQHQHGIARPTYCELHHVVPQAWQRFWTSPNPPPDAVRGTGDGRAPLWDARTVALCRTGHGNVHFWLVRLMHDFASFPSAGIPGAVAALRHDYTLRRLPPEVAVARLAMERWLAAGGDLLALAHVGLWGEI